MGRKQKSEPRTLEERLKDSVAYCLRHGHLSKAGKDKEDKNKWYCTLYFPESFHDPYICPKLGEKCLIRKKMGCGYNLVEFYACKR